LRNYLNSFKCSELNLGNYATVPELHPTPELPQIPWVEPISKGITQEIER